MIRLRTAQFAVHNNRAAIVCGGYLASLVPTNCNSCSSLAVLDLKGASQPHMGCVMQRSRSPEYLKDF